MKIYLMRHGTTNWNEKDITQGRSANRLSKNGVELTKKVSKEFKNNKIEVIISSPLMRTMQTANIMNIYHNAKILKDERITEIDQGIFTGRSKKGLTEEEKALKFSRSKQAKMENYREVFERVCGFVTDLKTQNFESVLVITHDVVAGFIEDIILNKTIDWENDSRPRRFQNCEMREYEI